MKLASSLGLFGLCLSIAVAAQEPKVEPKTSAGTGQKGELVPAPFRSYIVVDERLPVGINDDGKAFDVFLEALKQKDRTERQQLVAAKILEYEKSLQGSKKDAMEIADLVKRLKIHVEEWFAAYYARNRTDAMHCPICENGLNPIIAVIVRAEAKSLAGSGVAKLASEMNRLMTLPEYRGAKLAGVVIFLKVEGPEKTVTLTNADKSQTKVDLDSEYPDDENRDVYAKAIQELAKEIKAPNVVFALAPAKSKAAAAWGIGPDDEVTVIVSNHNRIVNRWKFKADAGPTDAEVKQIISTAEESITGEKK